MKHQFIHIRSNQFPVLPEEPSEVVNEGNYGKSLALYLHERLKQRGYDTPGVCSEDWGWWVSLQGAPFTFGVCVYGAPQNDPNPESQTMREFACSDGAPGDKVWIWRKLQSVPTADWVQRLHQDLLDIFRADPTIEIVSVSEEFPF